jgi:hypothetical protein
VPREERDSQSWILKALREAGNSLLSELYTLDDDELQQRPAEDEWSLIEIAAHLRDAEELALLQLSAAIEEPHKPLPAWDIDVLPTERDYRAADIGRILSEFRGLRRETTALLWDLSPSQWEATALHPYRGEVSVEQIARELAQHDLEHLWQIRRIKYR